MENEKPISERLKKFLHEHHEAVPILKDIDSLTEEQLENSLSVGDWKFSVEPPWDGLKWQISYGFDKEVINPNDEYDSYSEALEEGAIAFILSLGDERDKDGNLYLKIE